MPSVSEKPKKSLLARMISMEGAMAAFGLYSLVSGLVITTDKEEATTQIFWGILILCGLGLLVAVRRRDWKKHWEEMEAISAARLKRTHPEHTDPTHKEK